MKLYKLVSHEGSSTLYITGSLHDDHRFEISPSDPRHHFPHRMFHLYVLNLIASGKIDAFPQAQAQANKL